jgi:antitoxin FitA
MTKTRTISIWNVPAELHRRLKTQAAIEGVSLSDYVLREVTREAERATRKELIARLKNRPPVRLEQSAADLIREHRDGR